MGAASVVFTGISDAETVEALAIREALSLADDLLTRIVKVAPDCLSVINTMNEDSRPVYYHIIQEIKARGAHVDGIVFCHEKHTSNFEVHRLTRSSLRNNVVRFIWLLDPAKRLCIPRTLVN